MAPRCYIRLRCVISCNFSSLCRVGQISLVEGPLARYGEEGKYQELFLSALKQYGMLCIGIYRFIVVEITKALNSLEKLTLSGFMKRLAAKISSYRLRRDM